MSIKKNKALKDIRMIIVNLKDLMVKKGAAEGRRLLYDDISQATGIGTSTLSRIANKPGYNIKAEHIEKLCFYFECSPNDLLTFIPEKRS